MSGLIHPSDYERELEARLISARERQEEARRLRARHGLFGVLTRIRKPFTIVAATAGVIAASALVSALVTDSANCSIEVANEQGYASCSTTAGATAEYIGDQNQSFGSSGTGTFHSFVRIQGTPSEQGYNTDDQTPEFDTKKGNWTHSILVSDIPVVNIGGTNYWELFADINDGNGGVGSTISLNDVEVYFTSIADISGYDFGSDATKVYDLSGTIKINDVNQGSGRGDLRYRIPLTNITIPTGCDYGDDSCQTYFVLYTQWGTTGGAYISDGGFEEWKVKEYPTLKIVKNTTGGDGTFNFTVTGPSVPLTPAPNITTSGGTGSTPTYIVDPGTYTVSEQGPPSGWTLTGAVCSKNGAAPVTYTQGSDLVLGETDHFVCTFTNSLLPKLKVVKSLDPSSDPGKFNLRIDGATAGTGANVGDGGTTGFQSVSVGSHTVSETAGTGTSLANYSSSISCDNGASGSGVSLSTGPLTYGDAVTCTITNHRIPTIEVDKVLIPSTDPGLFNLQIDGATAGGATDVGDGGTTGVVQTTTGSHTVGETAGTGTTLSDYTSSTSCANNGGASSAYTGSLTVAYGDNWVCTITNSRLPTIIVKKVSTGSTGAFGFTTTGGNGFTTPFTLTTLVPGTPVQQAFVISAGGIGGDFTVTEDITGGFVLTDVSCAVTVTGDGGTTVSADVGTRTGSISSLAAGATVTCTFTNSGALTTRTQGFWATHSWLVALVWQPGGTTIGGITTDGMTDAERSLCTGTPLTVSQVMGGFWSNIAKTTTGAKRSALDHARMQLLQQLLAAILNNQLFGSSPSGMTIDAAKAAYCGTDITAIRNAQAAMASFNSSGDSGLFSPGGSADPKTSKAIADLAFWNTTYH